MIYLVNAFSINMLQREDAQVFFEPISKQRAAETLNLRFTPAIGHKETAVVVAADLGRHENLFNRTTVTLENGLDMLIVAQYTGPRLPEGATSLPEGAKIEYWAVYVV